MTNPSKSDAKKGDVVAAHVGEGARNVVVGKNIVQIGALELPQRLFWLLLLAATAAVILGIIAVRNNLATAEQTKEAVALLKATPTVTLTPPATPTPTVTALPFAPAAPDEMLVLITTFHSTTATNTEPHVKIRRAIAAQARTLGLDRLRVEIEPTTLTADQHAQAQELGARYRAAVVFWGEDTGVEVLVNYLNLRQSSDAFSAAVQIQERERTQLANPSGYARFITDDLPNQLTFLSFFTVGQYYYLDGDYPQALEMIKSALELLPVGWYDEMLANIQVDSLPWIQLEALVMSMWLEAKLADDADSTIAFASWTIRVLPDYAPPYNSRGDAYRQKEEYDAALQDFAKAIDLDATEPLYLINRGYTYYQSGELALAIADYSQAMKLDADNAGVYLDRGDAYRDQGEMAAAMQDYNRALELDPDYGLAYARRGYAHYLQENWDAAVADYAKALELDPADAGLHVDRGDALRDAGDLDAALAAYDQALALQPDYFEAYVRRAYVYVGRLDLAAALADLESARDLEPTRPEIYQALILIHQFTGNADAILQAYDKLIELEPQNAEYILQRANLRYASGELESAKQEYLQVVQLEAENAPAHNSLCWVYALLAQADSALPHCNRAIEIDPDPNYFDSRGLARALLGDKEGAIADLQTFVDATAALDNSDNADYLIERRAWIAALQRDENPFTPQVLEALRSQ